MSNFQSRLYRTATARAIAQAGDGWDLIGKRFQRALIAEEILILVNSQDEDIPDSTVRALADDLMRTLNAEYRD
ncbi:hypothetical protein SEA_PHRAPPUCCINO_181 [Mycobacterium phage Phrappuccino]|uniref:Uncharacterized protein n=1 Tax=Mycobacterium phage Phrappuccino TaxID=2591223 RepID=A0A514DE17_9CAUD|nr:hypothetical protein KHQ87_gp181 [Mycobacterium phage Phrappuccino]QDH91856.1 hypothetical protein SEA_PHRAPPUCCINO_181 [Mycobacterium phage Phrappuccino]QIQ63297.1 hypothetical protein SEA_SETTECANDELA_181 [Mycobacterium phage Settecandela]